MMSNKYLLLDRDGTLIEEVPYLSDPKLVKLEKHVGESLSLIAKKNIPIIVITNQSGIGRGYFSWEKLACVNQQVEELLKPFDVRISAWYVCPYHPTEGLGRFKKDCSTRKPKPGLILEACQDFDAKAEECTFVGDRLSDIQAGKAAGCKPILVQSGLANEIAPKDLPKELETITDFSKLPAHLGVT